MIIGDWLSRFYRYCGDLFHPKKLLYWVALWLFIWLFFPAKPYLSYDNHSVAMQPVTLVIGEGFELSRFKESQFAWEAWELSNHHVSYTYILISSVGKAVGNYPVFSALIMLPFYGIYSIFHPELWSVTTFNSVLWFANYSAAVSITVLTAFVWSRLLRGYGLSWRLVTFVVLVGIFATPVISVSSRFVWQHTTALLCHSLALWAFRERKGWLFHLTIVLGFLCRPGTILLIWPLVVFYWLEFIWNFRQIYWRGVYRAKKNFSLNKLATVAWQTFTTESLWLGAWLVGLLIISLAVQMWYSVTYLVEWFAFAPQYSMARFDVTQWWIGLSAQLFSPGRGLFFYSPMWLMAVVGLGKLPKREYVFIVCLIAYHFICGMWDMWHGGWSLSYRLVMDGIPIYMIGFGLFVRSFFGIHWLKLLTVALVSWAIIQHAVIGVFWEDCGYNLFPMNIDKTPYVEFMHRIWKETPLTRCIGIWQHEGFHPKFYWGR